MNITVIKQTMFVSMAVMPHIAIYYFSPFNTQ